MNVNMLTSPLNIPAANTGSDWLSVVTNSNSPFCCRGRKVKETSTVDFVSVRVGRVVPV